MALMSEKKESYPDMATPVVRPRRRSSIFNLDPPNEGLKTDFNYINQLKKENLDWVKLIEQRNAINKDRFNQKIELDKSILSEEQLNFIENRVDAQKFVDNFESFSKKAYTFIKTKEFTNRKQDFCNKMVDEAVVERSIHLARDSLM